MYLKFERNGQLSTRSRYKRHERDHFNFAIIDFPRLDNNIPTAPAYGVYISHLELHVYTPTVYNLCCLHNTKLSSQGFLKNRLNLFSQSLSEYINTLLKSILSLDDGRRYWHIRFWCKFDCCFPIISYLIPNI